MAAITEAWDKRGFLPSDLSVFQDAPPVLTCTLQYSAHQQQLAQRHQGDGSHNNNSLSSCHRELEVAERLAMLGKQASWRPSRLCLGATNE